MTIKHDYKEIKNWYIENFQSFEQKLNGESKSGLHEIRKKSLMKFEEIDFPTLKNEEWRYTNVAPIIQSNFIPSVNQSETIVDESEIEKFIFDDFEFHKLIFINGQFSKELSNIGELPEGAKIGSLREYYKTDSEFIEEYLAKELSDVNAFNLLNSAFTNDGLFVFVPKNKVIEKPIQVLFYSTSENTLNTPVNLVVAGENSNVKIFQHYAGRKVKYFTNSVSKIFADQNSVVDVYKIQNESTEAFHIEWLESELQKNTIVNHYSIAFGGSLVRNDYNSKLNDEFGSMNLYGLYLGNEDQHIDNHTFIDHAVPNCESSELYKGILDENAHGVFNGKILVRKDAQKTNAFQSNKTILLSDNANIDTKPQLEIYADDVKCSHGATIGRLDEISEFYLRSRGIPIDIAKSMLIRAFANDVIENIKIDSLREQLNTMIFDHLHRKKV